MSQLAKEWLEGALGDYFQTVTGSTPLKKKKHYYGGDVPFVKPPELLGGVIFKAEDNLTDEGAAVARVLPPKSVLVSCIGNLGKVGINTIPVAFNQQINAIIPDDKAIPEFLFYQVLSPSFINQLHKLAGGTTVPIVNKTKFNSINIVIPPLPEQKRIVAILDKAFVGINQAVANAEKNLANGRELFESYLNTIFTQKGNGWEETSLAEEIELLTGFAFKSKGYTSKGIRLLRGDNIIQGTFRWEDVKRWPEEDVDTYSKYQLKAGDIVLAMDRTWVKSGLKFAQLSHDDLPCLLVQRVARLRCKRSLESRFLKYLIGSGVFTKYVLSIQTGSGVPHISGAQIKAFKFNRPGFPTQKDISTEIERLHVKVQHLQSIYQQKLNALQELKQSILQKAFSGELTTDTIH